MKQFQCKCESAYGHFEMLSIGTCFLNFQEDFIEWDKLIQYEENKLAGKKRNSAKKSFITL